jgi:hypothetical protein
MNLFIFLQSSHGRNLTSRSEKRPFMEHPTGEYNNALEAIASAIKRLYKLKKWDKWITFSAQGKGSSPESYHVESVHMLGHTFDVGDHKIDLNAILQFAGLNDDNLLVTIENGKISFLKATPDQLAKFLDSLFRKGLDICPFDDADDYAVGAEWL